MKDHPPGPLARLGFLLGKTWLRCLLIALIGFCARIPALQGELIWDDLYLARDNPFIKSPLLILESFRHYLFPDSYAGHYRPVQTVTYAFDYLFWNADTYGYHLSNILWHVGSGILLYFLLRRLFFSLTSRRGKEIETPLPARQSLLSAAAFLLALLWVVHPVHSAAIDYISGRADSLAFFFAAGGWLLYLRAREVARPTGRWILYALAGVSTLLALCSRESGCMWVAVFLLHLFAFEKQQSLRTKLVVLSACLAILGAYWGLRQLPESRPVTATESLPAPVRAVLMLRALGDYGRLMVFPSQLRMERNVFEPASFRSVESWKRSIAIEYLSILGLVVLAVLIAGAFRQGPGQRARIFGASWFLLTFLPTSNLFDLNATVAEHWLYLPSVGLLIFVAGVLLDLPPRFRRAAATFACFAIVGLSARSAVRSSDWVDGETFYRRSFDAGASSARIGVNLAAIYANRGKYAKSETILRKVLRLVPDYPLARNNLATALSRQGKMKEAEELYGVAAKTAPEDRNQYPRTWDAALNLAGLRHKEKDDTSALRIAEQARKDYPGTWAIIVFEAEILRETKGPAAALPVVEEFARDHWWHYGAALALGKIYSEIGENERAEAAFRDASRLDVHDAEALSLSTLMSMRQERFEDAYRTQRRAVARQPNQPRQYWLLSEVLKKMGRTEEAGAMLAEVSRLQAIAASPVAVN